MKSQQRRDQDLILPRFRQKQQHGKAGLNILSVHSHCFFTSPCTERETAPKDVKEKERWNNGKK